MALRMIETGASVRDTEKRTQVAKKFQEKFGFPFDLLSDPDHKVIEAYDVWKEKSMYGKKYMGIVRSTYLIDEDGMIEKAFEKVKPAQDPQNMLNILSK